MGKLIIQIFGKLMIFELSEKKSQQIKVSPCLAVTGAILFLSVASCLITYGILYLIIIMIGG